MQNPKTNFMLLMTLLNLSPPELANEIGTDTTLISRWRTGNRRLIPGRHWIDKVANAFLRVDSERERSVIMPVISAMYPTRPQVTREQQLALIEDFLTCTGQMENAYRIRRYQLLSPILPGLLVNPESIDTEQPLMGVNYKGKQRLIGAMMTFLDVVSDIPSPRRIICAAPDGLNLLFEIDTTFALMVMSKLAALFEKGHSLALLVSAAHKPRADEYVLERLTLLQLQGHITVHHTSGSDMLNVFNKSSILWSTQQEIFLRVSFPDSDSGQINVNLLRAELPVRKIYYASLLLLNRTPAIIRCAMLNCPCAYFDSLQHERYKYVYVIARLPHFGLLGQQECRRAMTLKESEYFGLARDLMPLALSPRDYPKSTAVRHVFSIEDITLALEKQHHEVREMSLYLGRPVSFQRASLKLALEKMLHQLKSNPCYELALVDRMTFSKFGCDLYVGAPGYMLSYVPDRDAVASINHDFVASAVKYCDAQWERIPASMRSCENSIKMIESLL